MTSAIDEDAARLEPSRHPESKADVVETIALVLVMYAALVGLYIGWRSFWFLTDDAHISFRYVSNSILGFGYTWNPAPFRPVEGYTSFLWVALLDAVWRVFGLEPPQAANTISLIFSYLTLILGAFMLWRMKLPTNWRRWRVVLLALVLLGVLTNRTFLMWTSSGLETAMFNFFFTLWIACCLFLPAYGRSWLASMATASVLTYLSRPDGIVLIACTLVLAAAMFYALRSRHKLVWFDVAALIPLLGFPIHMLWRFWTYDAWLPNTYFAKTVAGRSMVSTGSKYLLSFMMEYALWIWLGIALLTAVVCLQRRGRQCPRQPADRPPLKALILAPDEPWPALGPSGEAGSLHLRWMAVGLMMLVILLSVIFAGRGQPQYLVIVGASVIFGLVLVPLGLSLSQWAAASVVWVEFVYYTFIIGGDHFEFRVYSYLVLLLGLSLVWLLGRLKLSPLAATGVLVICIALSLPIPWMHWSESQRRPDRTSTFMMKISMAKAWHDLVPGMPRWALDYLALYDRIQFDLIGHFVGMRHQEHKVYYELMTAISPTRAAGFQLQRADYPIFLSGSVGVQAWVMPYTYIIDELGLNDYVIARNSEIDSEGLMAHERRPPAGYEECFKGNVSIEDSKVTIRPRLTPLNAEDIVACEKKYALLVGGTYPDSLQQRMLSQH